MLACLRCLGASTSLTCSNERPIMDKVKTWQQVDPVHKNDDDVFPLYRAAPAKEQASFPTRNAELWLTKNKLAMHEILGAEPKEQTP